MRSRASRHTLPALIQWPRDEYLIATSTEGGTSSASAPKRQAPRPRQGPRPQRAWPAPRPPCMQTHGRRASHHASWWYLATPTQPRHAEGWYLATSTAGGTSSHQHSGWYLATSTEGGTSSHHAGMVPQAISTADGTWPPAQRVVPHSHQHSGWYLATSTEGGT